jgi:cytochrome P450
MDASHLIAPQPFPWARPTPLTMPSEYAALCEAAPVSRAALGSGQEVWLISQYDAVCQILCHPGLSSEHSHPAFPSIFPIRRHRNAAGVRPKLGYSGMDPPDHAVHRRIVAPMFSEHGLRRFRPRIETIVSQHLDDLFASPRPADIVSTLAEPVPSQVITELLGFDLDYLATLRELSRILVNRESQPTKAEAASRQLRLLIAESLRRREADSSGEGILSRMVRAYQQAGIYDRDQLVELVGALVTAGHETTTNMISVGLLALLAYGESAKALIAEPTLISPTIEELLRYLSIADLVAARVTTDSVSIAGYVIPKNSGVIALLGTANHDPSVFERPNQLDIHRKRNRHIAFGYGIHKCLGQHLARMELEIILSGLFHRSPDVRLMEDPAGVGIRRGAVLHGIERLLVGW